MNTDDPKAGNPGNPSSWARWFDWADDSHRVRQVVVGLIVLCVLLFVIDLFHHRHAYFSFEESRGFYAIAGFFAFAIIVLAAGQLRRLIRRPENYYGFRSTNAEPYPEAGLQLRTSSEYQVSTSGKVSGSDNSRGDQVS